MPHPDQRVLALVRDTVFIAVAAVADAYRRYLDKSQEDTADDVVSIITRARNSLMSELETKEARLKAADAVLFDDLSHTAEHALYIFGCAPGVGEADPDCNADRQRD